MKRLILCVLALFCCACGCQKKEITPMAAIQQKLTDMEGYSCLATLTIYSNKGETIYETKQDFKSTGEYRMEMLSPDSAKGNYTVFDGKTVCQYNPRLKESVQREVPESQRRNELFLGQFLKNSSQKEFPWKLPPLMKAAVRCWKRSFPKTAASLLPKNCG